MLSLPRAYGYFLERHSTSLGEVLHDSTGHKSCSLAIFESLKGGTALHCCGAYLKPFH